MSEVEADAAIIKHHGWRQGSVVPQAIVEKLRSEGRLPSNFGAGDILLVISHDCDVTRGDYASEPTVELLIVRVADKAEGNYFSCHSPRYFQVKDNASGQPVVYAMSVHDRFHVPRVHLAMSKPDATRVFEKETLLRIAFWLSRRYSRPSFPDAFNERTRQAVDSMLKQLKKNGDSVTGVYLTVIDEELPSGQDYEIVIRATMTVDHFQDKQLRLRAMELLNKLEAALGECDGIEVKESHLVSEAEVSIDDLRGLKRWDFDSISLRKEPVESLPQSA